MSPRGALDALVFAAVVALTAVALRPAPMAAEDESLRMLELPPGTSLDLLVPPDIERLRIATRVLGPSHTPPEWSPRYSVALRWLDPDDQPVFDRVVEFRSRVSSFPTPEARIERSRLQPADERVLSDSRTTVVPGGELLPAGGTLRVEAPADGPSLLVRVWGESERSRLDAERLGRAPSNQDRERLSGRIAATSWARLLPSERSLVAATRRRSLIPRGGSDSDLARRRVVPAEVAISWAEQSAVQLRLEPDRSLAVNLVGPVQVRLSGGRGASSLEVWVVSDREEGAPQAEIIERPAWPLGFHGEEEARLFEVPQDAAFSLRVRNDGQETVEPLLLSVDDPHPDRLWAWSVGVPLADRAPPGGAGTAETVLVAPEIRYLPRVRVGAEWPLPLQVGMYGVQTLAVIEARPVLADPGDVTERSVEVRWLDATDAVQRTATTPVPVTPATYERLMPAAQGHEPSEEGDWIGEPVRFYVAVGAETAALQVDSADDLLVTVRLQAAARGDGRWYPLPYESVRVRYASRSERTWETEPPLDPEALREAGQWSLVAANVRLEELEALGASSEGSAPRRYTSLEPHGGERRHPLRTWLVPARGGASGPLCCRVRPDDEEHAFRFDDTARRRLDGRLLGVLWTGSESLGAPFQVDIDGERWRGGTAGQRVTQFRAIRQPARSRVRYSGAEDSTLWLRTFARPGSGCASARRPVRAWRVPPGGTISFPIGKTQEEQLVIIGGLAAGDVEVRVRIDGGVRPVGPGLYPAITIVDRLMTLSVDPGAWARVLTDPDRAARILLTGAVRLGADLPNGAHTMEIQNMSSHSIELRAGLEGGGQRGFVPSVRPRLVRTGGDGG